MSEDRAALITEAEEAGPDLPRDASAPKSASRSATWPIIGFFIGFNVQPGLGIITDPREFALVSIAVGLVWAFIGWIAALMFSRWRGPTKTALPYSQGPKIAIAFNFRWP